MDFKLYLILIGTIWPVVGLLLVFLTASVISGWKRWIVLWAGPVLLLSPCYYFAEEIAYNGNMLFVAIAGIIYIFAIFYYPILAIWNIVAALKNRE